MLAIRSKYLFVLGFAFMQFLGLRETFGQSQEWGASETRSEKSLRFNFTGADWKSVLNWFSREANLNLEWVALPEGEFNLITEAEYSVKDALDIINMHLLARHFTLLKRDENLILVKIDEKFDNALVPRVTLEELDSLGRFDFVKVSVPLDWMLAESASKELAPLLSPHGKLIPLTKTNRIEAIDTVANLQEIRDLLANEESSNSKERLVTEFELEHTNAVDIIGKLHQLLGIDKPLTRMTNGQMNVMREQFAFKTELAKRMGDKAPSLEQSKTEVFLVANEHRNSIVANAPPDKIAIIQQAVEALDIPSSSNAARLSDITTMKVYPLNGADPEAVADILQDLVDIGELHPNSRFSEDDDKQILFAFASLKDHITIHSVMEQLQKSSRSFKVLPLKRLRASLVAKSIQTLMGAEVSSSGTERGGRRDNNQSAWQGFKVEADIPNNRLFLFATDSEFAKVEELLSKSGETTGSESRVRVVKIPPESMETTIRSIQDSWPAISNTPLKIEPQTQPVPIDNPSTQLLPQLKDKMKSDSPYVALVQVNSTAQEEPATSQLEEDLSFSHLPIKKPIVVQQRGNDELVYSSDDIQALQQMESLLAGYQTKVSSFTSFQLRHITPAQMDLKLLHVFGSSSGGEMTIPLSFVADEATRSIIVMGAGPAELDEIESLISFYDRPPVVDPKLERRPQFVKLKHANAAVVVATLKDIYRDYLSANDRDLLPQNRDRQANSAITANSGLLSIGSYRDTNTIVISAPEYLAKEVTSTIEGLDVPDASAVIKAVPMGDSLSSQAVITQLTNLLKTTETRQSSSVGNIERAARDRNREEPDNQDERTQIERARPAAQPRPRVQITPALRRR